MKQINQPVNVRESETNELIDCQIRPARNNMQGNRQTKKKSKSEPNNINRKKYEMKQRHMKQRHMKQILTENL